MYRLLLPAFLVIFSLCSCDKLFKLRETTKSPSIEDEITITSPEKPEIVAAFKAIYKANHEHNRVFLHHFDSGKPANEIAFSAGLDDLRSSANESSGLTKQVIDAVAATRLYEKDLFTPFDTIDRQLHGMPTWSKDQAIQVRGYIQIIDRIISTYDGAVAYLERGEQPLQQKNFNRYKVPAEVSTEFFRLNQLHGKQVADAKIGMFREQRTAMECQREAMTSANPTQANEHMAKAKEHEQKSKQFESQMIGLIRKQMTDSRAP